MRFLLDAVVEQMQCELAMRQPTKMTRSEALLPLQAKCLRSGWGNTLPVRVYSVISASDFTHQEPTQGGLIDH